ncbi:MAG: hypothetical protein ACSHYA_16745 [Opitutaceae bacterium]
MKNQYIGKWVEPLSDVIDLPYTKENFLRLLNEGEKKERKFTHRDIAHWCQKFWGIYSDVDASDEIEDIMCYLADVETQWDLYLANTYTLKELQNLEFHEVELPTEWFSEWIKQINQNQSQ